MVKGLVFDLDGVIINSHPAHKRAWREFLVTLGKHPSDGDLEFILEGRKREDILRHFLGNLSSLELAGFGRQKDEFFKKVSDEVPPVDGVLDFLKGLLDEEIPCAVATSASRRRTEITLDGLGLRTQFQVVVTAEDVVEGKPNPAIYRLAGRRLGLPASSILAFEDAPAGVKAATAAGMVCIGVAKGGKADALRDAGAEHVVPDFVNVSLRDLTEHFPVPVSRSL
jgi:beta-phosphoglucomutase